MFDQRIYRQEYVLSVISCKDCEKVWHRSSTTPRRTKVQNTENTKELKFNHSDKTLKSFAQHCAQTNHEFRKKFQERWIEIQRGCRCSQWSRKTVFRKHGIPSVNRTQSMNTRTFLRCTKSWLIPSGFSPFSKTPNLHLDAIWSFNAEEGYSNF